MFDLQAPFQPSGDQPQAIDKLIAGINAGKKYQTLMGVTGSGKTFTMANVIQQLQRPTLVLSHNKTLAAQLYSDQQLWLRSALTTRPDIPDQQIDVLGDELYDLRKEEIVDRNGSDNSMTSSILDSEDRIKRDVFIWLLNGGMLFDPENDAIGSEVLFSPSWRRSDLLILSDDFHALEIKGDTDHLDKLPNQLEDYCKTFDKVSVVTTPKHINRIHDTITKTVGLVLFEDKHFSVVRKPSRNRRLDKAYLLMFYTKKMLVDLLQLKGTQLYTGELRQMAAEKKSIATIREQAYLRLRNIYTELFQRFLKETGEYPIQIDEIRALSGKYPTLRLSQFQLTQSDM